jgi:hypothetical protein
VKRTSGGRRRALLVIGRLVSLALICVGWVFFRAPTLGQAGHMLLSMFTLRGLTPSYSVNDYLIVLLCMLEYALLEPAFKRVADRPPQSLRFHPARFWLRPLAYAAALDLVFMFDASNVAFIYFQF